MDLEETVSADVEDAQSRASVGDVNLQSPPLLHIKQKHTEVSFPGASQMKPSASQPLPSVRPRRGDDSERE